MSSNIAAFSLGIERDKKESVEMFDRRRRGVMLEATRGVVLLTPVLTGRARGNWQLTTEGGQPEVTEQVDPAGGSTISAIAGGVDATKGRPFTRHDLVNGLDYIVPLENGHSQQAPNGMVALTVDRLRRAGLVQ